MRRVGILGGGQLARMIALAGHPLGVHCRVLDPGERPPAADVADHVRGALDDADALARLADGVEVVTYETENVEPILAQRLGRDVAMRPHPRALATSSDRLDEKRFLRDLGISTAPFVAVETVGDLDRACAALHLPLVLKTRRHGYDGRGQVVATTLREAHAAWATLGQRGLIAEGFVRFDRELSIVAVRSTTGEIRSYPVVENRHRDGILLWTIAPAPCLDLRTQQVAETIVERILGALEYVGVLTVELFQCGDDLVVNEIAPRVHNSGHWTIEGAATSQFENHLRAILSLPLGSTAALGATVSMNLLGETPQIDGILALPDTHLHLYGKTPRPRRKIGHVTTRVGNPAEAAQRLEILTRLG
ncbi:MAG TPA: 5-(carboxyamino)imidazole ribonucleotide synthase [Candidatus Binatia bacterium]|nr:5-(carboxyamino)imidazole ribonucleotide synthase [Candidatus Binatia bacterium]